MSIIHDALKKTQQHLQATDDKSSKPSPETKPQLGDERFARPAAGTPSANSATSPSNSAPPMTEKNYESWSSTQPSSKPGTRSSAIAPVQQKKNIRKDDTARGPSKVPLLFLVLLATAGFYLYQIGFFKNDFGKIQAFIKKKIPTPSLQKAKPFLPPPATPAGHGQKPVTADETQMVLNGVMDLGDKVVALINNVIYKPGDTLAGMTIIEIGADFVRLEGNGKVKKLTIDGPP